VIVMPMTTSVFDRLYEDEREMNASLVHCYMA